MLTQKNCVKFVFTEGCYECSFCHGLFVQTDVVVATLQIQCGEYFGTTQVCIHFINLGKGIKDKLSQVYFCGT